VQPSERAFEGVRTPHSVWQIDLKTSGRQSNTVRMIGQAFPKFYKKLDFRSRHYLGSFCKTSERCGNTSRRCPAFHNIPVFRSNTERSYSEDRPDAQPSRPDIYLLWKDLCYSGRQSQKTVRTRLNCSPDAR
jgi:hypothetical protein